MDIEYLVPVFGIVAFALTYVVLPLLFVIALVALIRWLWRKGSK